MLEVPVRELPPEDPEAPPDHPEMCYKLHWYIYDQMLIVVKMLDILNFVEIIMRLFSHFLAVI